jgi:murein DD-endopeptidase MepM/ murein hydrolase activator NlpD
MKRGVQVLAILSLAIFLKNLPQIAGERVWSQLVLPYRLARLAALPAETAIAMPVPGADVERIADTWHAPRAPNRRHEGVDIFVEHGTPVVSATSGVVVGVGENRLGGRIVRVAGAGRRTYYYAHLDKWAENLFPGREVRPRSVLGYVGNTGNANATRPHLHFGIYGAGGAIDPLPLIAAAAEGGAGPEVNTR